jgi:hypothetical protein
LLVETFISDENKTTTITIKTTQEVSTRIFDIEQKRKNYDHYDEIEDDAGMGRNNNRTC